MQKITKGRISFDNAEVTIPTACEVLKSKYTEARLNGKGGSPNAVEPINDDDVKKLFDSKAIGFDSPWALITMINLTFTVHFGLRGRQEHHHMKFGDVKLKITDGKRYLEFTERISKTRKTLEKRRIPPRAYEDVGNPMCPVACFVFFVSKRSNVFGSKQIVE